MTDRTLMLDTSASVPKWFWWMWKRKKLVMHKGLNPPAASTKWKLKLIMCCWGKWDGQHQRLWCNLLKLFNVYDILCELCTYGSLLLRTYSSECMHSDVHILTVKCSGYCGVWFGRMAVACEWCDLQLGCKVQPTSGCCFASHAHIDRIL
jgi:hypothetical protein